MARKILKKAKAAKAEKPAKVEAPKPVVKAVSVDKMVEENHAAVVSTDYQKYIRKLMRQAAGKF